MKAKNFAVAVIFATVSASAGAAVAACPTKGVSELTGAGGTFIYPLMSKWSQEFGKLCGVKVNYQSIGSGGGIAQLQKMIVDFGESDAIMTDQQKKDAQGGAIDHIPVSRVGNLARLIEDLKKVGVWVYAVEPSAQKLVTQINLSGPVALVFGGEGQGVRPGVLQQCDDRVSIPMKGKVESLNVSAAVAVALFEAVRQRGESGSRKKTPTES